MQITEVEVRCCRRETPSISADSLRQSSAGGELEFLVVTLHTDAGITASSFGFAGRSARGSGELAAAAMRPFLTGRNPLDREAIWQDFLVEDRWWNHLPIYSFGPFDICLWVLGALDAGQPLYRYIGGFRDTIETYVSSLVLPSPEAYGQEALEAKNKGYRAYKVHPPGTNVGEVIDIHRAVRAAVGDDFPLMSDPVGTLPFDETLLLGRELERLGYVWLEEPFLDENISALKELTRRLDIPIIGGEVLKRHPYSAAQLLGDRIVDHVRADVSWSGGVTGVMKTARLAEAFHANCEIHSSILHPLELVNLHCCGAVANNRYFELLYPTDTFAFGLKQPLPIENGIARLPQEPGLGIDFDWDLIDNCTTAEV